MIRKKNIFIISTGFLVSTHPTCAQEHVPSQKDQHGGNLTGTAGCDVWYYMRDEGSGAQFVEDRLRMNSFLQLMYKKGGFSAGLRYEAYLPRPLLGIDPRFEGQGIAFRYAAYAWKGLEVTAGSFYEQFGNGLIFRAYEARPLGFDNFVDGLRIKYALKGIQLKALAGRMRNFWSWSPGYVRGGDAEVNFSELLPALAKTRFNLIVGGSFMGKYQSDKELVLGNEILTLPQNVGAWAGRATLVAGAFSLSGEIAWKANDPSVVNNYIYKNGSAFLVTLNYATNNMGFSLGAKRIDNMDFRTSRYVTGNEQLINWIPMLNKQHTYMLAASIYPYAVQYMGENGLQADVQLHIPKGSRLGGKYGMDINFNASIVYGLDTLNGTARGGYRSKLWSLGKQYYHDFNVEVSKKFSKKWKLNAMYMKLFTNLSVVPVSQLSSPPPAVSAHIGVADVAWRLTSDHNLRLELQTLYTRDDAGTWFFALLEYTYAPHWFVSLMNQYNPGHPIPERRIHYPMISAGYNLGNHRFQLSAGRQRAGILCIGGVCRAVPAATGITLSYIGTF
ncbi:MAG: DUF6029 family protein [Flavobacteriales bacterium]|nr:DUF6029 family protein [Flavobacteriales bacterium]